MAKNRLQFDEFTEDNDQVEAHYRPDVPGDPVYFDEYRKSRSSGLLKWFTIAGVLLLIAAAVSVAWYYHSKKPPEQTAAESEMRFDPDKLRERYYLPSDLTPELEKAVSKYRSGYRDEAKRQFEEIVQGDHSDGVKSVALVYLGVMSMETERYGQAKHQLLRALKYNQSVAALVNLSMVERRMGNLQAAKDYADQARELAPRDPQVALLLGNILSDNQDPDAAAEAYREGIESSPDDPYLRYNLALSLLRRNNFEEAIVQFSMLTDIENGMLAARSHGHLGQIYFSKQNFERAADHLRKATVLAPGEARFHYNLGVTMLKLNQDQEALNAFQNALESGSSEIEVYQGLSRAFKKLNQNTLAERALQKALYVNPASVSTLFLLGDIQYESRDLMGALETYKKIVNTTPGDANTVDALLRTGEVYMALERYSDAVNALQKAAEIRGDDTAVLLALGTAFERANRIDEAVAVWKKALSQANLDRADEKPVRMKLASLYQSRGAYDLALNEYKRILERNRQQPVIDDDPEVFLAAGKLFVQSGDFDSAVSYLEKVTVSRSADIEMRKSAFKRLAVAHSKRNTPESLEKARSAAYQAARLDPADPEVAMIRSGILLETGSAVDREKAIENLMALTASDLSPDQSAKAYNLLGLAYYKNGEYRRSLSAFDHAVDLDPTFREAYDNQRAAANAYEKSRL